MISAAVGPFAPPALEPGAVLVVGFPPVLLQPTSAAAVSPAPIAADVPRKRRRPNAEDLDRYDCIVSMFPPKHLERGTCHDGLKPRALVIPSSVVPERADLQGVRRRRRCNRTRRESRRRAPRVEG